MAMNFIPTNLKLEMKKDVPSSYDNGPSTVSTSSSIFGRIGVSNYSANGGGNGITCRVCGKNDNVTSEFDTICLGDLFPNMSSSALSSPVAATTVAVGLCANCSKGQRSTINPIFQQAVTKTENRSSILLQHQQSLMPSMFRGWNSSSDRSTVTTTSTTNNKQYSPKKQNPNTISSISLGTITTPGSVLPISVLAGNSSGNRNPNPPPKKTKKKKSQVGLNLKQSATMTTTSGQSEVSSAEKSVPHLGPVPMALNLNLLASASILSSEGLVIGKKSSPAPKTPGKTNQRLDCSICNRTFKSAKIAAQHLKKVHNNVESYCCDICGAVFSYRGSLDSHLASHKPPLVTFDCPTCGQKFKEKANLNTHVKLHSDTPKKFKCEFCPSGFSKKVNLRNHTKRKHPDQVMNTDPNNPQMQPGQYNNGTGMGMGNMGYPSSSTNASGVNKSPGKDNNSDKPEGNFKCEHCGRAFLFKNNLKAHLRTHTRDRKYTCEICEKSFIYKESLKNHMLLHSNEVPYQCDICLKKFRDRSNRRKHVKNVHKYMFVNGDASSLAPIGGRSATGTESGATSSVQGSSGVAPPPKKTRRKKVTNTNEPDTSTTTSPAKAPKRSRKSAKNSAASGSANNTVIVSTASCSDQDRKIIMSPGPKMTAGQQSIEYNLHSQNLPVTVHVPSPSSMFGRNVIVKASGVPTTSAVPLTQFSDPYNRDSSSISSASMQQNVIVYPKPKHSLLESYSSEPLSQSSVISQHMYYGGGGQGQGMPIGVTYSEPSPSYGSLMVPSPRSTTPLANNTFESYAIAANRRNSSGSTSKSPDSGIISHPQYSVSPAPIFSSPGPLRTEPYFWANADNVNQTVSQSHGSPFYNSPQHSTASTPTPIPILDNNSANVLNVPSYAQSPQEIVGGMDAFSTTSTTLSSCPNTVTSANPNSVYFKDFDFSYL